MGKLLSALGNGALDWIETHPDDAKLLVHTLFDWLVEKAKEAASAPKAQ